jgi:hypothetical protein
MKNGGNNMSRLNGRMFALITPRSKEERGKCAYALTKQKTKKILCSDGKTRRFCDGIENWGGGFNPVCCAECGYDFNFHDINDRTTSSLVNHTCDLSPYPMTPEEEKEYFHCVSLNSYTEEAWKKTLKNKQ